MHYPIFLDLHERRCLVAGAGNVGCRKIMALAEAEPAEIIVIDPHPSPEAQQLAQRLPVVSLLSRRVEKEDILTSDLVFAASGDSDVNQMLADLCKAKNILCNCADNPAKSTFFVPAVVKKGRISIAVSTDGASPALARSLRKRLEFFLSDGLADLAEFMAMIRFPILQLGLPQKQNAAIFRALAESPLHEALNRRNEDRCRQIAESILPASLHSLCRTLIHELVQKYRPQ
ncbi:MAG: bifunctional precorrin-2 dehydrogenase/sirohydrochlorin ferrochelatase [Desulfovibrionaceae bacterium]|nr:bifunctional precorrin-2 dehydrogenase/sirohydrochlorin ferrochelatase [Desulfovibrionaceae bacterium]